MKVKYVNNKPELGINYDWDLVKREYNRLNVPEGYYEINWGALKNDAIKFIMSLSERSTGKTTNLGLLVGLVLNKLYGTTVVYIRATEGELSASHAQKLVEVVRLYNGGEYVRKLTDGKYNSLYYHWRQFFYCFVDENGERVETAKEPCIQLLSVDRANDYKSTLNLPLGDWIVFDEFIGKYYRPDEAIHFLDLLKTIIRDRLSPTVVMLANTINLNSPYFEEMEIGRDVRRLQKGDKKVITTERGTNIYIEIVNLIRKDSTHSLLNSLFFGFKNPKINAITGGEVWAFENVPHILHEATDKLVILRNIYIESGLELLQVEIVANKEQGAHLEVHRATKTYDDSYILTLSELKDKRYHYGLGGERVHRILSEYIIDRRVYYSSNEVGSIFKDYVNRYKLERNSI